MEYLAANNRGTYGIDSFEPLTAVSLEKRPIRLGPNVRIVKIARPR